MIFHTEDEKRATQTILVRSNLNMTAGEVANVLNAINNAPVMSEELAKLYLLEVEAGKRASKEASKRASKGASDEREDEKVVDISKDTEE